MNQEVNTVFETQLNELIHNFKYFSLYSKTDDLIICTDRMQFQTMKFSTTSPFLKQNVMIIMISFNNCAIYATKG